MAADRDEMDARIAEVLGADEELDFNDARQRFLEHLKQHLELPCEVTGSEDFQWEEFYVIGPGDEAEYAQLRRTQPSFQDRYDLLGIELGEHSKWMLFWDDIVAACRRRSDGREFQLGLSELEATRQSSANYQLLQDYSSWFVNSR
jgi:hypothetical protein